MKKLIALGIAVVSLIAGAQPSVPDTAASRDAAEHGRIRQEREQALARFQAQDAQCYQRFAVSDCLADVRAERRLLLAELRRQEISLNDAQRKRRAANQLLRADEKAAGKP